MDSNPTQKPTPDRCTMSTMRLVDIATLSMATTQHCGPPSLSSRGGPGSVEQGCSLCGPEPKLSNDHVRVLQRQNWVSRRLATPGSKTASREGATFPHRKQGSTRASPCHGSLSLLSTHTCWRKPVKTFQRGEEHYVNPVTTTVRETCIPDDTYVGAS